MSKPKPRPISNMAYYLRTASQLTQNQLSAATGLKQSVISRIETGGYISQVQAEVLGAYYGVAPDTLYVSRYADLIRTEFRPRNRRLDERNDRDAMQMLRTVNCRNAALDYVLANERVRLSDTDYLDLINSNFADESNPPFDVLSFERNGSPRYIILVATLYENDPMTLSSRKYHTMVKRPNDVCVYHVVFQPELKCFIYKTSVFLEQHQAVVSQYRLGGARKEA